MACKRYFVFSVVIMAWFSAVYAEERADSVYDLQEVVVTGTSSPMSERLMPYNVTTVNERYLDNAGSTQVLSAISGAVPSLFVSERGIFGFGVSNGGSGHIKLRGVGGDRASAVLMMMDGQPQFAGIYSHHIADFYDKEYVERVEVLRGPGSVLYGSNAMAGAINIITKQPRQKGVRTTLSTQYGSYNTWLSSATNMIRLGKFYSLASLSYNCTDGNVKNFDFNQVDGYVKAGYDFSNHWSAYLDYSLMHFNGNDPIYPRLSNPESTDIYHQSVTRGETNLTALNRYGATDGTARVYYSYGNHFVDDPRHFHSTDDRIGFMANQNFHPWRGAAATIGFDFDLYRGEIPMSGGSAHKPGSMSTMERKHVAEYSPFITFSQLLSNEIISLNGGLRLSLSDKFTTQFVPQFGFAVNPGDSWLIKGNLSMGYRNPSFREMYLYRMANPDLQPEKMMNYELTVGRNITSCVSVALTGYYLRGYDMIQVLDNKNVNTGRFINKGIELTATATPLSSMHITATYSYLHTSLRNLTGAPKNQYSLSADYTLWKKLTIFAQLQGVGGLYVSDDTPHQNYALLNLKLTYKLNRYIELFTRLENLTDTRYTINKGYEMPGFTAFGGLKLRF